MLPFTFNSGEFSYTGSENLSGEGKYHGLPSLLRLFVQPILMTEKKKKNKKEDSKELVRHKSSWNSHSLPGSRLQFTWGKAKVLLAFLLFLPYLINWRVLQWFGFSEDTLAVTELAATWVQATIVSPCVYTGNAHLIFYSLHSTFINY